MATNLSSSLRNITLSSDEATADFGVVAAIDFGTSSSGFAFGFRKKGSAEIKLSDIQLNKWQLSSASSSVDKAPTTLLLKPDRSFDSFGFEAEDTFAKLDAMRRQDWWYFARFKMELYKNKVALLTLLVSVLMVHTHVDGRRVSFENDEQPGDVTVSYDDHAVVICPSGNRGRCRRVRYTCLKKKNPAQFMTAGEFGRIYNLPHRPAACRAKRDEHQTSTCTRPYSDNDRCCETLRWFTEAPTSVLVDNKPCYIIHIPRLNEYQYVPDGKCGSTGSCDGECIEEATVHPVVCFQWSWRWPYSFTIQHRIGYVNTTNHCSCKNVQG